ncbi:MAG TPA: glycine betaine ABC transporter substrate-binding protein, partial [Caldimonas sp.]|nr:glycine betaine ABC transporter substrate-binding protein [Caldimonas sp.]
MSGAGRFLLVAWAAVFLVTASRAFAADERVVIGSKGFPESWILGEVVAARVRAAGAEAVQRRNLGGTEIVFEALRTGAIDVYAEYTGTIAEVILKATDRPPLATIRDRMASLGIGVGEPLGFNDGYAIATRHSIADTLPSATVSALATRTGLRGGFTHEFLARQDGYEGLAARYGLHLSSVRGMEHALAYAAMASGAIDLMEVYTTDAQVARQDLVLLDDDRNYFQRYDAVLLYRLDLPARAPRAFARLSTLSSKIDAAAMTRANARVVLDHAAPDQAAAELLRDTLGDDGGAQTASKRSVAL